MSFVRWPAALQPFRPRLISVLPTLRRPLLWTELGAGVTVGIVALPLAMAFAIASGLPPEAGLFTAIIAGFLISALGGSHVQIGGPAGAFIVVVYGIVERHGVGNLLIATAMAGVILFLMGWFRLGVLVRYIPVSIVIGFTNGIAVLIALSQLKDLLGLRIAKMPADFFAQWQALLTHLHSLNPWALALGLGCLGLVAIWPRATDPVSSLWSQRLSKVPGTVVALALATLLSSLLDLPVETIGSRFGGIPRGLPSFQWPSFSWLSVKQLLMPALTLAMLGAIESLLCARVADNLADIPRHDPNQELMAQGIANLVTPFFGGLPATGTIARTVTNVRAGGRTPVAGMVHAFTLLIIMLVAAPWAANVPLAALAGILLFVAWNMGEWREFARLRHFHLPYRTVMLGTFVCTVVFDLTVAVELGLVAACGFFIYRMSTLFDVKPLPIETAEGSATVPADTVVLGLYGALFFGAVGKLESLCEHLPAGTRHVVLDLHRLVSLDTSGLEALVQLEHALARQQIQLWLAAPNAQPLSLMHRGGLVALLGDERLCATVDAAIQSAQQGAALSSRRTT